MQLTEILSVAAELCPNRVHRDPVHREIVIVSKDGDSRVRIGHDPDQPPEWLSTREERNRHEQWDASSSEAIDTLDDVRKICTELSSDD
jgi:hypothetical protein